ncbi:hypothetical protein KEM54_004247, partial [Ascosphaera aggregata]
WWFRLSWGFAGIVLGVASHMQVDAEMGRPLIEPMKTTENAPRCQHVVVPPASTLGMRNEPMEDANVGVAIPTTSRMPLPTAAQLGDQRYINTFEALSEPSGIAQPPPFPSRVPPMEVGGGYALAAEQMPQQGLTHRDMNLHQTTAYGPHAAMGYQPWINPQLPMNYQQSGQMAAVPHATQVAPMQVQAAAAAAAAAAAGVNPQMPPFQAGLPPEAVEDMREAYRYGFTAPLGVGEVAGAKLVCVDKDLRITNIEAESTDDGNNSPYGGKSAVYPKNPVDERKPQNTVIRLIDEPVAVPVARITSDGDANDAYEGVVNEGRSGLDWFNSRCGLVINRCNAM